MKALPSPRRMKTSRGGVSVGNSNGMFAAVSSGAHLGAPHRRTRLARRSCPAGTPRRTAARGLDRSRRIVEGRWGALGRRPGRGANSASSQTLEVFALH
jgi:hypothetical protein